jgi:hypothetical protein
VFSFENLKESMQDRQTFFNHETMVDNNKFGKLESKVQETELTVISNRELIDALQT